MVDKKYYEFPETVGINDADRLLIFDANTGTSRNITGSVLKASGAVFVDAVSGRKFQMGIEIRDVGLPTEYIEPVWAEIVATLSTWLWADGTELAWADGQGIEI